LMVDTVRFPKEGLICKTVLRNAPPIIDHDDGSQA
jgi:hypothetical protein